jgi:hypothetical protein
MDSTEKRHFLFEFPAELVHSDEFRPELDKLIEEFSIRLGTLAER